MADAMREALEKIAAFDCDSWMIGVKCSGCRTCIAAEALAQHPAMSAADEAEQFIQDAIDRAPEPLRRLGEYLTQILDEDEWKTAERMLIGAAEQPAQGEAMAAPNWQPIETAPKDGTTILLTAPGRVTVGEWHPEQWPTASEYHGTTGEYLGQYETGECKPASWISWDGGFFDEDPPTHWMPLPEPPK